MKKGIRRVLYVVLAAALMISMLTACGPKKPTPEDAQAYVRAVLDLMCTGDYDHSVELSDIEEGKESETRDALVSEMIKGIGDESNLSEDVTNAFRDFMIKALESSKYTVGEATATEDGGYDVSVSIEPLKLFSGVDKELNKVLEEKVAAEPDKILAMSEEEQTNYVMEILLEILNKKLEKPKYDDAEEVVVHYGPLEDQDGVYGCTAADGEELGKKLFSRDGL